MNFTKQIGFTNKIWKNYKKTYIIECIGFYLYIYFWSNILCCLKSTGMDNNYKPSTNYTVFRLYIASLKILCLFYNSYVTIHFKFGNLNFYTVLIHFTSCFNTLILNMNLFVNCNIISLYLLKAFVFYLATLFYKSL